MDLDKDLQEFSDNYFLRSEDKERVRRFVKDQIRQALELACERAEAEMEHVKYDNDRPVVNKESIMRIMEEIK